MKNKKNSHFIETSGMDGHHVETKRSLVNSGWAPWRHRVQYWDQWGGVGVPG